MSIFKYLYDRDDLEKNAGQSCFTGTIQSIRLRLNQLLIPGTKAAMYVGTAATADICKKHLKTANITAKNCTLISGRSIHRIAKDVQVMIQKVDAIAKSLLNQDGSLPSGTTLEFSLKL